MLLCITALGSAGGAAAHQRGDASLPADGDGWAELGIEFITHGQQSISTVTGDVYVLPASGTEVVVADGVDAIDPAETTFEDQVLITAPGGFGAVAVLEGLAPPLSIMEAYVEGFTESSVPAEEIDVQSDRGQATGLYIVQMDNVPMGFYITVDAVTSPGNFIIQVVVTPTDGMVEAIALLRGNVLVNGIPMFEGVDEHELQSQIDAHTGN